MLTEAELPPSLHFHEVPARVTDEVRVQRSQYGCSHVTRTIFTPSGKLLMTLHQSPLFQATLIYSFSETCPTASEASRTYEERSLVLPDSWSLQHPVSGLGDTAAEATSTIIGSLGGENWRVSWVLWRVNTTIEAIIIQGPVSDMQLSLALCLTLAHRVTP